MKVAIIGGTGLATLTGDSTPVGSPDTPSGRTSDAPRQYENLPNAVFLNRHAEGHTVLPHEINYRANLWLLNEMGVDAVVAVFAVGGIDRSLADGAFVLPDQLIDYTWGREHTFATPDNFLHADFSEPFDAGLRVGLCQAAERIGLELREGGVYGCTQGPRFETVAEIDRMERDGCTVVGMTAMPEAALARELGLPYAGVCVVVNPAAGRGPERIDVADMMIVVADAEPKLLRLLVEFLDVAKKIV